jgi:hypothetical protein
MSTVLFKSKSFSKRFRGKDKPTGDARDGTLSESTNDIPSHSKSKSTSTIVLEKKTDEKAIRKSIEASGMISKEKSGPSKPSSNRGSSFFNRRSKDYKKDATPSSSTASNGQSKKLSGTIAEPPKAYVRGLKPDAEREVLPTPIRPSEPRKTSAGRPRSTSPSTRQAQRDLVEQGPPKLVRKESPTKSGTPKGSLLRRPLSAVFARGTPSNIGGQPQVPTIPASYSSDHVQNRSQFLARPANGSTSRDASPNSGVDTPPKRDEMWNQFRMLDLEHGKFISKGGPVRANIIRTALLPFLRSSPNLSSLIALRAEDLDRRVKILDKWWTSLLEMLHGIEGHSVAASDRPAVLEGLSLLMARFEWRAPLSSVSGRRAQDLSSRSGTSLEFSSTDFVAETIINKVSGIFAEKLLSQMAFVVERMSMRNVPPSVVHFCGNCVAYAFLFCPGLAEVLTGLWKIPSSVIDRVLKEAGLPRSANKTDVKQDHFKAYPAHLQPLAFSSVPKLMKQQRQKAAPFPESTTGLHWDGPWKNRWSGRDSDLFYIFFKHFYTLTFDMLPYSSSQSERLYAPCALLVQAQLLNITDNIISRAVLQAEPMKGPAAVTFDDVLGADASAAILTLPPPSATRFMGDNKLMVFLRDFLSIAQTNSMEARKAFAVQFHDLTVAAARKISLYDHNACFILCDFLEEALPILAKFHGNVEDPLYFVAWRFWLEVFQYMGSSNNTMTGVRLYAFIYSLWPLLSKSDYMRKSICEKWLLEHHFFEEQFCHWCPMIRAYYMRLLCWRICRYDSEDNETNTEIYTLVFERLQQMWGYYLGAKRQAEGKGILPLSTAPCTPAPGNRFLILRNDSGPAQRPKAVRDISFDSLMASAMIGQSNAYEKYTPINILKQTQSDGDLVTTGNKKRWTMLKSLNPFAGAETPLAEEKRESARNASPTRSGTSKLRSASPASTSSSRSTSPGIPHTQCSFKFSLEWTGRGLLPKDIDLMAPRLPLPAQMNLESKFPELHTGQPPSPRGAVQSHVKYVGHALAEWNMLLKEHQNFYERRKAEGVPNLKMMETPTLGVESFRRPGG